MTVAKGKGYAKVILFGEHFVVYGLPGVAAGLDKCVEIEAENVKNSQDIVFDDKVFNQKISMKKEPEHVKCRLFNAMFSDEEYVPKEGIKFTINSTFSPGGGMGYSAALCVAMARAMNLLFSQNWKDEKINAIAYKGECVNHGTPSGIDNTCATYGTTILFEKDLNGGKNKIRPLKCDSPLYIVLADTGIKHDTKQSVADVKKRKEGNPAEYEKIFLEYKKIIAGAKTALKFGEIEEIGKLMNQNQSLLSEIGVSCSQAEEIIKLANYENAVGAKITGAGNGGNVLVLCRDEKSQDKLIKRLEAQNYSAIKAKII
jgi:mevalonate kinase